MRNATPDDYIRRMTDDDVTAKFVRAANYRHMAAVQRDQALAQWWNLSAVKDIAEPMRTLASFGTPKPL